MLEISKFEKPNKHVLTHILLISECPKILKDRNEIIKISKKVEELNHFLG